LHREHVQVIGNPVAVFFHPTEWVDQPPGDTAPALADPIEEELVPCRCGESVHRRLVAAVQRAGYHLTGGQIGGGSGVDEAQAVTARHVPTGIHS